MTYEIWRYDTFEDSVSLVLVCADDFAQYLSNGIRLSLEKGISHEYYKLECMKSVHHVLQLGDAILLRSRTLCTPNYYLGI